MKTATCQLLSPAKLTSAAVRARAFAAAALLTLTAIVQGQTTATLVSLHTFTGTGTDGAQPYAALVQGSDGNFYDTTVGNGSGSSPQGTVFKLTPAGVFTTLHSFTGTGTDGAQPYAALAQGSDGNFYGTTVGGGSGTAGTVFKMTPAGMLATLHSFTGTGTDGGQPYAALVRGVDGNFYGTTVGNGTGSSPHGTVFKLTPAGVLTTLHSFTGTGTDGAQPYAALAQGKDGNFYGTTRGNGSGSSPYGTVFKITPAGVLTTLHGFTSNGTEAMFPNALVQGSDGSFYGTSQGGGSAGNGTVFSITSAGVPATLHSFSVYDGNGDNGDGAVPLSGLVLGSDGNFYGATQTAGGKGDGTLFSITSTGVLTTLYNFSASDDNNANTDGAQPNAALVQGSDGNFYSTTIAGGTSGSGTVFELTFPHPAFFIGEVALTEGVYYLAFSNGNYFGNYKFLTDPHYVYHFDLGFEYVFDANDGHGGVYLYDFTSKGFFYTSPSFPFPYLYDFNLKSIVYYYPDPRNAGHYNTDGIRYFYVFSTGKIISK